LRSEGWIYFIIHGVVSNPLMIEYQIYQPHYNSNITPMRVMMIGEGTIDSVMIIILYEHTKNKNSAVVQSILLLD